MRLRIMNGAGRLTPGDNETLWTQVQRLEALAHALGSDDAELEVGFAALPNEAGYTAELLFGMGEHVFAAERRGASSRGVLKGAFSDLQQQIDALPLSPADRWRATLARRGEALRN